MNLGFDRVGIARIEALPPARLQQWLASGCHDGMHYMADRMAQRHDPRLLVENAQSIVVVALNYFVARAQPPGADEGRIARYAWGRDYHEVMRERLQQLLHKIQALAPGSSGRGFVDSAPVLEKVWAQRAGIGWQGKNSLVISPGVGSWMVLGELIIDIALPADVPARNRCGSCRLCLDACPTGALVAPGLLDARRCLSCLTVERKAEHSIPEEWAHKMNGFVFGCDICQEVCPFNQRWAHTTAEPAFRPRPWRTGIALTQYADLPEEDFQTLFAGSSIKRTKYAGFMRNVRAALGV